MKVVIEIPNSLYANIKKIQRGSIASKRLLDCVKNGTPLPKGHGRIIDESQVTGTFTWDNGFIECFAPTIIEADEESEG